MDGHKDGDLSKKAVKVEILPSLELLLVGEVDEMVHTDAAKRIADLNVSMHLLFEMG